MALELSDAEKYELAELLRQTIAAEGDMPSLRTQALQAVLEKLDTEAARKTAAAATPRQAAIRRFTGQWRQEVSDEDSILQQQAERAHAERRSARDVGYAMIAAAAVGLLALLIALVR